MTVSIAPLVRQQFSQGGVPVAGGKLFTYAAGTTTKLATYTDSTGGTPNTNPIILDSQGSCDLWLTTGTKYKLVVSPATDTDPPTNPIWTRDNIVAGADSSISLPGGASLVGFQQAGAGAVTTRTAQDKLREIVSVKDFGAKGDGTTDDTAAIQAAITYANSIGGAIVWLPPGTYKTTSTLAMAKYVTLQGPGKHAGVVSYNGTADAVKMSSPINSSTAVYTAMRDMGVTMTNGAATGGCYDDVGGTFVEVTNCALYGGKFGVIFDQTELATIRLCDIESQVAGGAGVWLVNGPDHSPVASSQFTNRILITECQFNNGSTLASHIIDDGGISHTIRSNNFNSGVTAANPPLCRFAAVTGLVIDGENEFEGGQTFLQFETTTFYGGVAAGGSSAVSVIGNTFSQSQPNTPIVMNAFANPMLMIGNWFGGSAAFKVTGVSLNTTFIGLGNVYTAGALCDSEATYHVVIDNNGAYFNGLQIGGGGYGYVSGKGVGGSVTQAAGSKANGVTLNTITGEIVLSNANIAANTTVDIPFTNSKIGANDIVVVQRKSGGTDGSYQVGCDRVFAGGCQIWFRNNTAGALAEAVTLQFEVRHSVVN